MQSNKIRLYSRPLLLLSLAATASLMISATAQGQEKDSKKSEGDKVLRVCQDPNNMPMSSQDKSGYENKIAELFAKKLGWKLEHTWYPQRMGFTRATLTAKDPKTDRYKCDVVTGVSPGFERGIPTKRYMTSTYALVYPKGKGLDSIKTPNDITKLDKKTLEGIKIGAFTGTPPINWLLTHGLLENTVSYQLQTGDPDQYPGQIIQHDLAAGKIDVAIAWGPIAGYYAKHADGGVPMNVVPFDNNLDHQQFAFNIAMGVRHDSKKLRNRLNELIDSSEQEIAAILAEYDVPTATPPAERHHEDDDDDD